MKLSKDDKIRQHATQQLRTNWILDFKDFEDRFKINFNEYFSKEIDTLKELEIDGLVEIFEDKIKVTVLGRDFAQFITNRFDAYDPPSKSYKERLEVITRAKELQKKSLEYFERL